MEILFAQILNFNEYIKVAKWYKLPVDMYWPDCNICKNHTNKLRRYQYKGYYTRICKSCYDNCASKYIGKNFNINDQLYMVTQSAFVRSKCLICRKHGNLKWYTKPHGFICADCEPKLDSLIVL
jgi:hypothetical protein